MPAHIGESRCAEAEGLQISATAHRRRPYWVPHHKSCIVQRVAQTLVKAPAPQDLGFLGSESPKWGSSMSSGPLCDRLSYAASPPECNARSCRGQGRASQAGRTLAVPRGRSTWSASALTAACTGYVSGRSRRNTLVTQGLSCGWPLGISDRQQARDLVRLVPGRERLTIERESPRPRMPPSYRWFVPDRGGRWRPVWHEWQSRRPQRLVRR
jgi:hypothetical protein